MESRKSPRAAPAILAATLLLHLAAPSLAAARYESNTHHHGASSDHHPGCPFAASGECPHQRHDGRATLTSCGDNAMTTAVTTIAYLVSRETDDGHHHDGFSAHAYGLSIHAAPHEPDRSVDPPPPRANRP